MVPLTAFPSGFLSANLVSLPFDTEITNGWVGDMSVVPKAGDALTFATGGSPPPWTWWSRWSG